LIAATPSITCFEFYVDILSEFSTLSEKTRSPKEQWLFGITKSLTTTIAHVSKSMKKCNTQSSI